MMANVYAVKLDGLWRARMTIAPEVDRMYWFGDAPLPKLKTESTGEPDGKRRSARGIGAFGGAERAWFWKEALPLGQACELVVLWETRDGWNKKKRPGKIGDDEALRLLGELVGQVSREIAGEAGKRRWRLGLWSVKTGARMSGAVVSEGSLMGRAERWERGEKEGLRQGGKRAENGCESDMVTERAIGEATMKKAAAGAQLAAELLQGRALLSGEARALLEGAEPGAAGSWSEAIQLAALLGRVRLRGAIAAEGGGRSGASRRRRCLRCGSGEARMRRTACAACGRICAYCEACLTMGRSRECELLVTGKYDSPLTAMNHETSVERLERWKLSPAQTAAAAKALRFVEEPADGKAVRSFLLWAVTGAGKTEMIFPLIESVLLRGGRALIATPRRDVVIELDPRIRKAFPEASVVTLYGGSEQRWESGEITLATTHQLLRFQECFDLVIVDEIDAFPYHGDEMLYYAADKSCLPGAARLLLSATPPLPMQRAARRGKLPHARVPVRYHRHPLPVPTLLRTMKVKQMLDAQRVPAALLAALRRSYRRGAQIFVFVQRIAQVDQMAALLRSKLGIQAVAATSSQDPERAGKVQNFRSTAIRILVTTTILERGVTIPKSDVYILDADGRLFDEASLVQMAGRAGRSADDPNGHVYFCSSERNRSQVQAVRHIRTMNRIARKHGYLLPKPAKGGLLR